MSSHTRGNIVCPQKLRKRTNQVRIPSYRRKQKERPNRRSFLMLLYKLDKVFAGDRL